MHANTDRKITFEKEALSFFCPSVYPLNSGIITYYDTREVCFNIQEKSEQRKISGRTIIMGTSWNVGIHVMAPTTYIF
jgi:hypothetical protein